MITIDGSSGEGGGQILRTALALSLVTGQPFCIQNIRARRPKPGLQRQHLTAVLAAQQVGQADVDGAVLGSRELRFVPHGLRPGEHRFAIGTAGSTTLVLQTVLPALMLASEPSRLTLEGGTHNIHAPPAEFLQHAFLPIVGRMGVSVDLAVERPGFYPAGGGRLHVEIRPAERLEPVEILQRGRVVRRSVCGVVARLPRHIAEREVETARRALGWPTDSVRIREVDSVGPGNVLLIEVHSEHVSEVFAGFGQLGVPAEKVATHAARQARRYLDADVPVGLHLADQLLLPLALAGRGCFRTLEPTEHTRTNIQTIGRFLDVPVRATAVGPDNWTIEVG